METISVFGGLGGSTKTTLSVEIAYGIATQGKRVLLLDLDESANSSIFFGLPKGKAKSIYDVLMNDTELDEILYEISPGLSVALGTNRLNGWELVSDGSGTAFKRKWLPVDRIRKVLKEAEKNWDFVIVDHPGYKYDVNHEALKASNRVIIPLDVSTCYEGAFKLMWAAIERAEEENPDLLVNGFIVNCYQEEEPLYQMRKENFEKEAALLNIDILGYIQKSDEVIKGQFYSQPLQKLLPSSPIAKEFAAMALTVMERSIG